MNSIIEKKPNRLYLLERLTGVGYDEYDSFVVAAPTANMARKTIGGHCGDEGNVWIDPTRVTITKISDSTNLTSGIVLGSFNAG